MRNSYFALIIAGCLAFFVSGFSAQAAPAQTTIKIGTISIQKILEESKAGQQAQKTLQAELVRQKSKLEKDQDGVALMKSEIEKKSSVWSDDVRADKEREYQKKLRELKLKSDDAKYAMQQLEKKIMEPILKDLNDVIEVVGKREGFTMIFENSLKGLRSKNGLLYADKAIDVSDLVRKELDVRRKKK